ncbi:hypothetical protein J7E88_03605 [Streptomyces sp. ISL-10]|uniref:hypothetical protein n=1 Tax=Streptomyces sp. ISL-10 TaxID=2819172 RepID=UPI001BE71E12|nr:hypothetical protein [Streptomyces sp. ISL-10]MBT2364433.1 hypothetical protein [Streptomyces sp. ISL-10]
MPKASRFDQRAVALIELRGTRIECDMFEEALAARGWPVLEKRGGTGSEVTERRAWYTIEARFPGSRFNAVRGARERIEAISDELLLDLNVEVVDRVVRDPVDRPHWFAYRRPQAHPRSAPLPRWRRWAERSMLWQAENLGVRDTGRLITATSASAAQHLATRALPGTALQPGRVAARRPMGTGPRTDLGRRRESGRLLARLLMLMALALWAGARIADRHAQGFDSWWGFAVIGLGAVLATAFVFRQAFPATSKAAALVVGVVLGATSAVFGAHMVRTEPGSGWGSRVIVYGFAAGLVFNGIRLLVRQWSWQRTAPWLLPALLPISLGFLPSLGLGLHTFYLDAFGLNLEDVEIPRAYQFAASVKLTVCMSLWLAALALLGYMKHLHLYVKDRWFGNVVLAVVSLVLLLQGALELGVLSAGRAGSQAVAAAKGGRTPVAYFGIAPEWVCAHPIGKAEEIPVEGGEFVPSRPYLKVGDAGGTVVLWDAGRQQALKLAKDRLRIVPDDRRPASCG